MAGKALSKPTLRVQSQRSVEMFAAGPADQSVVVLARWSNDEINTPCSPATTTHVAPALRFHHTPRAQCTGSNPQYHATINSHKLKPGFQPYACNAGFTQAIAQGPKHASQEKQNVF